MAKSTNTTNDYHVKLIFIWLNLSLVNQHLIKTLVKNI